MVHFYSYFQISILIGLSIGGSIRQRRAVELNALAPVGTNDSALVDQSNMDLPWEQLIVSGPMTVNLLGQLMVVSSKLDFSFLAYSPNYTFTYMLYPRSFRATLVQISNDGWQAFLAAHTNMNKIQLYMQTIPGFVKTALKVLTSSSTSLITNLIPKILNQIQSIGKDCVAISNQTHQTFVNVMNLLGEVIAVTEVTRGLQATRLQQTEIELNVSRVMQGQLNELGKTIKSHYEETRDIVQQAQSEYSKALSQIPSGFKGMIQDAVRAVMRVVSVFSGALTDGKFSGPSSEAQEALANGASLAYSKLFKDGLDELSITVTHVFSSSGNGNSSVNPLDKLEALKITFQMYLGTINTGATSDLKAKTIELLQEGVGLVDNFLVLGKRAIGTGQPVNTSALETQLASLLEQVKPMALAESLQSKSTSEQGSAIAPISSSSGNEVMIAKMQGERLRIAEQRYNSMFAQLKSQQEQMGQLMSRIATLDLTRIDYVQILDLLREALHCLGTLREQWNQLVLFFAEIAARAEIALGGTIGPFIEQVTLAGASDISHDERLFYVDLLKTQAIDINKQSYMLFIMSSTYVDMSDKYLLKRLGGLSQLLTAQSDPERTRLTQQLLKETTTAQEQVVALVNERKATFTQTIAARQAELDKFVQQMGGVSENDLVAIEKPNKFSKTLLKLLAKQILINSIL